MKLKVLVSFAVLFVVSVNKSVASDYEIILERIESALGADDQVLRVDTLRIKKFNRTAYVLDGSYEILQPIQETFTVSATALNFQGNQYKKMGDKSTTNLCTLGYNETFRDSFEDFQRHQKFPVPWKTCPYPAGRNEISNFMLKDYADLLPAYIPGNEKWKTENRVYKGDDCLGGYNIYCTLRNQKSLMMGGK